MTDQENPDSPVSTRQARRITQLREAKRSLNLAHCAITDEYDESLADVLDAIDAAIETVQKARRLA